jgi:CRP-like cAMP-binding protein
MTRKLDKANCTNVEWVGRAQCEKCHIRQVMLFSELPQSAFDNSLQPINNYIYPADSVLYETGTDKKFIYSIRRGMVKLVHLTKDGSYRIVRLALPLIITLP